MSSFHAVWSVGGFVGAGTVFLMATVLDLRGAAIVQPLLLLLAGVALAGFVVAWRITPATALVPQTKDGTKVRTIAWVLTIMAVAFGLS